MSSFFRWGNGGLKKLNTLPDFTANKQNWDWNQGLTSKPCLQATLLNTSSTRELHRVRSTPKAEGTTRKAVGKNLRKGHVLGRRRDEHRSQKLPMSGPDPL